MLLFRLLLLWLLVLKLLLPWFQDLGWLLVRLQKRVWLISVTKIWIAIRVLHIGVIFRRLCVLGHCTVNFVGSNRNLDQRITPAVAFAQEVLPHEYARIRLTLNI